MAVFSYRLILKPVLIILCLVTSLATYAAVNYGVIFDNDMMVNIFETDSAEATAYISVSAALYFILLGLLPAIFIFRLKINYGTSIIKNMLQRIAAVIVLGVVAVAIVLPNFHILPFYRP